MQVHGLLALLFFMVHGIEPILPFNIVRWAAVGSAAARVKTIRWAS